MSGPAWLDVASESSHHEHAADVRGAPAEALTESGELDPIGVMDAELARAILAGDLADRRRNADAGERTC